MKIRVFAIAAAAVKNTRTNYDINTVTSVYSIAAMASSETEARGAAWEFLMKECPVSEDWIKHTISVTEFRQDQIERIGKDE